MSCPTCSHTMQSIGYHPAIGGPPVFWCPRCGTLKSIDTGLGTDLVEAPKLVDRCRQLEREYLMDADRLMSSEYPPLTKDWTRLGIAESIHP